MCSGNLGIWGDGRCRVVRQALGAGAGVKGIGASGAEDASLSGVYNAMNLEGQQKRRRSRSHHKGQRPFGRSVVRLCGSAPAVGGASRAL